MGSFLVRFEFRGDLAETERSGDGIYWAMLYMKNHAIPLSYEF
jgi:hypothetical protein